MDHHPVPHIDATMGHARCVIGAYKKHQIAGFRVAGRGADVIEPLGSQAAHIPAGVIDHPGHTKPEQSKDVAGELPPHT